MTKYVYYPHFGLVLMAQNTWTEKVQNRIKKEVISKFITYEKHGVWGTYDVSSWDEVALFSPGKPENNEAWGEFGVIKLCEICNVIYDILVEKKGRNDRLILFSHSLIEKTGLMSFVNILITNQKIKKILVLQLEEVETTGKITQEVLAKIIKKIGSLRIRHSEFIHLVKEEQIDPYIIYEIMKEKYF